MEMLRLDKEEIEKRGTIYIKQGIHKPPTFKELFPATHLVKESKKKFWDGVYDEGLDEAVFCTTRSRKAYEEYATTMIERHGEDVSQHPVGDVELWESTQGGSKFGIGSSDSNFVITGAPSLSSGSTPSYVEYQRSQEKVRDLQSQVEELHNRVEDVQQKMREEVQQHMREEIQQMREEMKEEMQRQVAELMEKFSNPGNPT
ncbi:hypothetical protein R6Q57_029960 [Mikania cordata]